MWTVRLLMTFSGFNSFSLAVFFVSCCSSGLFLLLFLPELLSSVREVFDSFTEISKYPHKLHILKIAYFLGHINTDKLL